MHDMGDIKANSHNESFHRIASFELKPSGENFKAVSTQDLEEFAHDAFLKFKVDEKYGPGAGSTATEYGSADEFMYGSRNGTFAHNRGFSSRFMNENVVGGAVSMIGGNVGMAATSAGISYLAVSAGVGCPPLIVVFAAGVVVGYIGYQIGANSGLGEYLNSKFDDSNISISSNDTGDRLAISYFADGNDLHRTTRIITPFANALSENETLSIDHGQSFIYQVNASGNIVKSASPLIQGESLWGDLSDMENIESQGIEIANLKLKNSEKRGIKNDTAMELTFISVDGVPSKLVLDSTHPVYQLRCAQEISQLMKLKCTRTDTDCADGIEVSTYSSSPITEHIDPLCKIAIDHLSKYQEKFAKISLQVDSENKEYREDLQVYEQLISSYRKGLQAMRKNFREMHPDEPLPDKLAELMELITDASTALEVHDDLVGDRASRTLAMIMRKPTKAPLYVVGDKFALSTMATDFESGLFTKHGFNPQSFSGVFVKNSDDNIVGLNPQASMVELSQDLNTNRKKRLTELFSRYAGAQGAKISGSQLDLFKTMDNGFVVNAGEDAVYTIEEFTQDLEEDPWIKQDALDYKFMKEIHKRLNNSSYNHEQGGTAYFNKLFFDLVRSEDSSIEKRLELRTKLIDYLSLQAQDLTVQEKYLLTRFVDILASCDQESLRVFSIFNLDSPDELSDAVMVRRNNGTFVDNAAVNAIWDRIFSDPEFGHEYRKQVGINSKSEMVLILKSALNKLKLARIDPFNNRILE